MFGRCPCLVAMVCLSWWTPPVQAVCARTLCACKDSDEEATRKLRVMSARGSNAYAIACAMSDLVSLFR